jgi:hypothetical protein
MDIERHEFRAAKLKGLTIFRIVQDINHVYFTEPVAERIRQLGLQGFVLAKVWPLPPGENWWRVYKRESTKLKRRGLPKGKRVKGESVFIELKTLKAKPATVERRMIEQVMDELDALLVDRQAKSPAVGSLEGHEYDTGLCRLKLSCPDGAKLVTKLRSWLRQLKWPGEVTVIKRDGGFDWVEATETRVRVRRKRKAAK